MNHKGYGYAGVGQSHRRAVPEMGAAAFYAEHERQSALDRLANNKQKMLGMMGVKDTTERSQRYTNGASLSQSKHNGVFREDKYQFPPGGLRGGDRRTKTLVVLPLSVGLRQAVVVLVVVARRNTSTLRKVRSGWRTGRTVASLN